MMDRECFMDTKQRTRKANIYAVKNTIKEWRKQYEEQQ